MENQSTYLSDKFKQYESELNIMFSDDLIIDKVVCIRLDGHAFSSMKKKWKLSEPFDDRFHDWMNATCESLMEYIGGSCSFIYSQSDEITIIFHSYENGNNFLSFRLQKLVSLLAGNCSAAFNKAMASTFLKEIENGNCIYKSICDIPFAFFDARVFIVPKNEVDDMIGWRQADAFKNCVNAFSYYTIAKDIGKKSSLKMLKNMSVGSRIKYLNSMEGVDFSKDVDNRYKRGFCLYRKSESRNLREYLGDEKFNDLLSRGKVKEDQTVERGFIHKCYDMPNLRDEQNKDFVYNICFNNISNDKEIEINL
jgi:tRNA(His) guanylyltransferase